jgi:hemolysin III
MRAGELARDELWNTLTHGFGAVASALVAVALLVSALSDGDGFRIAGVAVFGVTLVLLYTASTLYHSARVGRVKARLKVLDHACIYLLIAGTYTPFTLGPLRGAWGWSLFGAVWGLAAAGVVFKLFYTGRFDRLSTVIYVAMGWIAVVAAGPMLRTLPGAALGWLLAGGIAYTAGTFFYHNRRIPQSHAIWHLFVLSGSACHITAVALI